MGQHQPIKWLHLGELIWDEIAIHTLTFSVDDLVSLSQTCRSLNRVSMQQLYRKMYIVEDGVEPEPGMVLLYRYNLDRFIRSLQENAKLAIFIRKIVIMTDSNLCRSFVKNEYESLYEQLIRCKEQFGENVGVQYLKNLDANNMTQHEGLLEYLQMRATRKNLKSDSCECLYENDEDEFNGYPDESSQMVEKIPWRSVQIANFTELEFVADSAREMYFSTERAPTFPLSRFSALFHNTTRLELQTSSATESFSKANGVLFPALETLSIAHTRRSFTTMQNLFTVINFQSLQSLEVKYDNKEKDETFLSWWFQELLNQQLPNLKRLSFVNLSTRNFLLNSFGGSQLDNAGPFPELRSGWCVLAQNLEWSEFFKKMKLQYFYCNLNNFDFIPIPVDDRAKIKLLHQGKDQRFLFKVNTCYYKVKRGCFANLYNGSNLKQLVIPDYFYTWKLFINFTLDGQVSDKAPQTIVEYLNQCQCDKCFQRRKVFVESSKVMGPSFCGNCSTTSNLSQCQDLVSCFEDTSNYRYFYHMVVKMLKERLPLNDRIMKNHSGLDMFEFPFAKESATSRENWQYRRNKTETVMLMIHNLVPDLRYFKRQNPDLKDLVLGGLYFQFEGMKAKAVHYDRVVDIA